MKYSDKQVMIFVTFYLFSGYFLHNSYYRAAVGETLAMIFLPLVFVGVRLITFGDYKKWWVLTWDAWPSLFPCFIGPFGFSYDFLSSGN